MANNFISAGDVTELTVSGAVASGSGVLNGNLFGVALNATTAAGEVPCGISGIWDVPKTAPLVINKGDLLYWDTTPGEANKTAAAQVCIGKAVRAALSADTTVRVLFQPGPV